MLPENACGLRHVVSAGMLLREVAPRPPRRMAMPLKVGYNQRLSEVSFGGDRPNGRADPHRNKANSEH